MYVPTAEFYVRQIWWKLPLQNHSPCIRGAGGPEMRKRLTPGLQKATPLSPLSERQGFLSLSLEWGGWGKQRFHTCLLKVKLLSSSLRTSKIYFRIRALELPPKAYSQISDLDGCSVSRLKGLNPTVCHAHYSASCPLLSLFALSQYFNAAKCRLHFRTPE